MISSLAELGIKYKRNGEKGTTNSVWKGYRAVLRDRRNSAHGRPITFIKWIHKNIDDFTMKFR